MSNSGWRKPTPGLLRAEQLAQEGERLSVPRSQAVGAVKKVAAYLGLKSADIVVLDILCAFSQPQDWEQGRRPIVWASNAYLEEKTGLTLRSLQRHVRRLCEFGIISMKDSPNGKRYGRRDDEGHIVEAFGFDLSPVAARADEFELINARQAEEREFCRSMRANITIARRVIRAKIEQAIEACLVGPWQELQKQFQMLLLELPKRNAAPETLIDALERFGAFKEEVETAFRKAYGSTQKDENEGDFDQKTQNMSPKHDSNDTHYLITNQQNLQKSNRKDEHNPEETPVTQNSEVDALSLNLDVPIIMVACAEFGELAKALEGGFVRNWNDLHRAASKIRPMAGISEDAWTQANQILGPIGAAAALALTYDKHATGQVKSPGGYLRAMIERARGGELHLEQSIFGRLNHVRV